MMPRKPAKKKAPTKVTGTWISTSTESPKLYTLEVFIVSGPISDAFVEKNPEISRTIQIRGDQTLDDLHHAIFKAFNRFEAHMYEFQFGEGPADPKARRYVLPGPYDLELKEGGAPAGRTDATAVGSLQLKKDDAFGYLFDFGDDWWHQINVNAIDDAAPKGTFPKVIKRVGKSPPQYMNYDEVEDE
jgi:hypothetical protein